MMNTTSILMLGICHNISNISGGTLALNLTVAMTTQVATDYINLIIPPILIILGVTCNTLTICTMRTKFFKNVSTSVYLKAGAFNDALALLISLVSHWLYVNFPSIFVRTESSHVMCKFFNFYGPANTDLGILITACMTAERALAIASPLRGAKFCTVTRAWKVVIATIAVIVVKDFHFIITSDVVPADREDRLCDVVYESHGDVYETFWLDIWPWINLTFMTICGIIMIISNSVILHSVRKSAADQHAGGQTWRHLLPMLLGESLLLAILTFPFAVHLASLAIRLKYDPTIYTDENKASTENLVFSITFYMLYSNKCANFFMYCATGSKFREGLRMTVMMCFCRGRQWRMKTRSALFMTTMSSAELFTRRMSGALNQIQNSSSESINSQSLNDANVFEERTQSSKSVYL